MNNTTSTKEKVVVGGALVGGLIFFGFLTNTCQSPLDHFKNDATSASVATISDDSGLKARIAELENNIQTLKDNSADEKAIADLEAQLYNQRAQAADGLESLEKQNADLKARIKSLASVPAVGEVPKIDESVNTDELNAKISSLTSELKIAEMKAAKQSETLRTMSGFASDAEEATKLAEKVKFLNEDNKGLADQLTKLKSELELAKGSSVAPGQDAELNAKIASLTKAVTNQKTKLGDKDETIADLNARINKLKAANNMFAKSTDDLPQSAQGLIKDLNTLEGKSVAEVQTAYTQYLEKHKATAKMRIKFTSGSSLLSAKDKEDIAKLTQAAGRNTYFLIVGYADKSGTAASNEKLSSARSTSVAKELGVSAKANQSTQAIYLGQTGRFGAASENRVVEIWEIK